MPATVFEVAEPQCVAEEFDGEIVAINLDTGLYFSMKDTGALLWRELVAGHSVESLLELAGDAEMAEAVKRFTGELLSGGLMRQTLSPQTGCESTKPGLLALATMAPPYLESFGDMQSLLLLDPVHEVEQEVGWPKIRGD